MGYDDNPRWSGEWHIVNTADGTSLESWRLERQAQFFCDAVNEHEAKHNRPQVYAVEQHPRSWRKR